MQDFYYESEKNGIFEYKNRLEESINNGASSLRNHLTRVNRIIKNCESNL